MLVDPKKLSKSEISDLIERTSAEIFGMQTEIFDMQTKISQKKHQLEELERELERRIDLGIPR